MHTRTSLAQSATDDQSPYGSDAMQAQISRFTSDLHRALRERNQARSALRKSRIDALMRLVAASEFKDSDTGLHIMRMGHYSAILARTLGQSADYCDDLLYASRMHDVGKIGVPDAILQKPGKLTELEWQTMRRHPEIGCALLRDGEDPMFHLAAEVALTHHEKFDGSGYPHGLSSDAIPLGGRIVAVADFFDALTMDRCYRPAMSDEQAFTLLREGRGNHFDPQVVDAFFEAQQTIVETRARINAGD